MAVDVWKRTESAVRDVYAVGELGKFAQEELPDIANEWRSAAADMRAELSQPVERPALATSPIPPEVVAQRLAEAEQQGVALAQAGPMMIQMMRGSTLPQFRTQAQAVRDGAMPPHDFDLAIECQFRMGILTADELAELRGTAGTPGFA